MFRGEWTCQVILREVIVTVFHNFQAVVLSQALDALGRSELREWCEMDFGHPREGFGAAEVIKSLGILAGGEILGSVEKSHCAFRAEAPGIVLCAEGRYSATWTSTDPWWSVTWPSLPLTGTERTPFIYS